MIVIRCEDCGGVDIARQESNAHTRLAIAFAIEQSVNRLKAHQRDVHNDDEVKFSYHVSVPGSNR